MTTTQNPPKTGAKNNAAKTRTPAPDLDFSKVAAKASSEPVTQTRSSKLDSTPVPKWLEESWAKRETVKRGKDDKLEGAAVELSPMSAEQVAYLKTLLNRGVQRMPGVGVKFSETVNPDKTVTLKFQTMQRKARAPKA